jgi:hypothetical protein
LGIGDWAQSPIPNPQSPIPNPQSPINIELFYKFYKYNKFKGKNIYLIKTMKKMKFKLEKNLDFKPNDIHFKNSIYFNE